MHRAHVDKEWIDSFLLDEGIPLPADAAKRFMRVVRVRTDEVIGLFDGCGREVIGTLSTGKYGVGIKKISVRYAELPKASIVLIQAAIEPTKLINTIARATEFGVSKIIVFESDNSNRFSYKKLVDKGERLFRIAEDASRQSERMYIPSIDMIKDIETALKAYDPKTSLGMVGDARADTLLSHVLAGRGATNDFYVAIGPEGGLTMEEQDLMVAAGFIRVRWAPHVLRTELACLAPIAMINAASGRA